MIVASGASPYHLHVGTLLPKSILMIALRRNATAGDETGSVRNGPFGVPVQLR